MSEFFLQKNVAKIGDDVLIKGDCGSGAVFVSSNTDVANISGSGITANNVGETEIFENTFPVNLCTNSGGLSFTVTDDGTAPLMTQKEYMDYSNIELIFSCMIIVVVFFTLNWRK